ncbi:MAG: enoyl-CoA hydratase/isomerase family protein [Chloroflexi bacterium]|nr:enoyl-CoA hydratase/isomerase family protein [Chloroflexota bacterium]
MPRYQAIKVERDGQVGVITLNRPESLNALSAQLFEEFYEAFDTLDADDETSVIVVTGAGDRAFSAGSDIKEMVRLAQEGLPAPAERFTEHQWCLANSRKPTIGALNGLCYGGGAVMASCLDLRVGCSKTRFRFLAVTYGRLNSTWTLPTLVTLPIAKELLFTGRVVEPEEARQIGLLNRLVEPERVLPEAMELAHTIAGNDQRMVEGAKRLLREDIGAAWRLRFESEKIAIRETLKPNPVQESFRDFIARRGTGS